MKKLKKFFTEERVDEIYETMFDLAMGLGPVLMVVIPILYDAFKIIINLRLCLSLKSTGGNHMKKIRNNQSF